MCHKGYIGHLNELRGWGGNGEVIHKTIHQLDQLLHTHILERAIAKDITILAHHGIHLHIAHKAKGNKISLWCDFSPLLLLLLLLLLQELIDRQAR